jgi:hypothetical protein
MPRLGTREVLQELSETGLACEVIVLSVHLGGRSTTV